MTPVTRALVSVYDKDGVADLARRLHDLDIEIVSTGSTAARIRDAGVPVVEVADVTGFPEILDGRVKTLHPRIHGGLLADLDRPGHPAQLEQHGIAPFGLVVVNLYPFEQAVADGADDATTIEMIDIGGPTLLRAAAKNHAHVGVVVRPDDYDHVLGAIEADGAMDDDLRRRLAADAFAHVAAYDAAIANWFHRDEQPPAALSLSLVRRQALRYGENPHQRAALYVRPGARPGGVAGARQRHGRELSYNNLLDTDAALRMVDDFDEPCVAVVKHMNPAGLAVAADLATAYGRALEGDRTSAFGGIVAANRRIDAATAEQIAEIFTEVVIAPGFDADAFDLLAAKKNLRLLELSDGERTAGRQDVRSIAGGVLVQDLDAGRDPESEWRVAGAVQPDEATTADLRFAWTAARHVKSNAIVLARGRQVVGVGAGQMSRVDAVRLAVEKSDGRAAGAVLASDAFFPFRDGPDAAAAAGVTAIIQPGGSVRDDEVVAAADEHGVAMVLTGRRHFRH